ncbi:threonine synthase [Robiginitalea sediminis]|uniref:threonine synthase n=1 Tax=Robiginitalea sediminis TaxID=1982593 RepID=UPI000B4BB06D|nr:threonine synthase [Robiginitalea sediminis]
MEYYSLNGNAPRVRFDQAVLRGIAPDKGLYFPTEIPVREPAFWNGLGAMEVPDLALDLMQPFVGDTVPKGRLRDILEETLAFEFPLVEVSPGVFALELYHGPTMAFKDVGSRFMARCLGHFSAGSDQQVTVLVATSGDTGGAVAHGFLGVEGVQVVILYPEGKVSDIQERQLTTLGKNIRALRVRGTFDDCQAMVKTAFLDPDLEGAVRLTSANSINVARWIPQMLYYVLAVRALGPGAAAPVFAVPSGNFGNICAGLLARHMGMPCAHFIAATNANDTVPRYMQTGRYDPHPAVPTISNAMDVADPSNFVRIRELFGDRFPELSATLSARAFTDTQTREAMKTLYDSYGYVADPHGAVGYLGLQAFRDTYPEAPGIFLETAHPIKFRPEVENTLGLRLDIPPQIQTVMGKEKQWFPVAHYEDVKAFLLDSAAG